MDWTARASCAGVPTDMFYLEENHGTGHPLIKSVCNMCPVQVHCAIAGLAEDYGHWGGAAPDTRVQWRRQLKLSSALPSSGHESRYDRYLPLMRRIFADAKVMGIKSAFVSNMADQRAAAHWLRATFADEAVSA